MSANGGYFSGLVAAHVASPVAEVTLRHPPPLDVPLDVSETDAGALRVMHGDVLVAEATAAVIDAPPLVAPTPDVARAASESYPGFADHLFPTCFACGPRRPASDGLAIFPGPIAYGAVACVWVPDGSVADDDGAVPREVVWASLDCPGAWSLPSLPSPDRPVVLGRLAVRIDRVPRVGEELVVTGRHDRTDGRKHYTSTSLTDEDGQVIAIGRSTWIELRDRGGL